MIIIIALIVSQILFFLQLAAICRRNMYKSKKMILNKSECVDTEAVYTNGIKKILRNYINGSVLIGTTYIGMIPSHLLRNFLFRKICCMKLGRNVVIHYGVQVRAPWNISIGEGTIIGDKAILDGRNGLIIGDHVNFSTGVWIWTEQHDLNDSLFRCNNKGGSVIIGDRSWISCRTVILPRVNIGYGTVVAAGAVVTNDCENYGIYGGIPAKLIGRRSHELNYVFDGDCSMFF